MTAVRVVSEPVRPFFTVRNLYHSMPYAAARANHTLVGERLLVRVDGLERRRVVLSALIQEHQP